MRIASAFSAAAFLRAIRHRIVKIRCHGYRINRTARVKIAEQSAGEFEPRKDLG
jgi:hypothetical protein